MQDITISFPDEREAVQGQLAMELADELAGTMPKLQHQVSRARMDTQDAGTLVSVVLAAPAIVAFVNGLWGWMKRSNQTTVDVTLSNGTVLKIRNAESNDVAVAIEALGKADQ